MERPQPRYKKGDKIDGRFEVHDVKMGGMGEVYLCLDRKDMVPIALKTFKQRYLTDFQLREAFEREVSTWISLEVHPNIVHCFLMQTLDYQPFMHLEWVASTHSYGTDLRSWLIHRPLDLNLALLFAIDICRGLVHAQMKQPGLVHRDLKPENILIMQGMIAKITDFGLAQVVQQSDLNISASTGKREGLVKQGRIVGTPPYMAPEQWGGDMLDHRTDIYAVGCILYEMLTGRRPFLAATLEGMRRQHQEAAIPLLSGNSSLPADILNPIISSCLAKAREDRFSDFEQLLNQLESLYEQKVGESARLLTYPAGYDKFTAVDYNNRGTTYGTLGQYDKAIADFDRAIQLQVTDQSMTAMVYVNRGITFNKMNKYQQALADFNKAIEIDPKNILAYNSRAAALGELGRYDEALGDHNKCVEIDPNDEQTYVNRGLTYQLLGQYEQALVNYTKALEIDPNLVLGYVNRGSTLSSLGRYEDAIADLGRALEIDPGYAQAYFNRGNIYDDMLDFNAALADYGRAIELDPDLAEAYANRGMIFYLLQKYDTALADIDRAIKINPNHAKAYYNRGRVYQDLHQYDVAVEDYTKAIEMDPNLGQAYDNRGMVLKKLGYLREALADFNQAIEIDPQNVLAYNNRAGAFSDLQQYDAALNDYGRAIEINPAFVNAYNNRGTVYVRLGQQNAAIADLSRAIEIDPNYAQAYLNRGNIFSQLHQIEPAIADFSRAIELDSTLVQAYHNRGLNYSILKQHHAALADMDRAINLNPTYSRAYITRGSILLELKQYSDSLRDFNKAIEVDPDNSYAYIGAGSLLSQLGRIRQALPYLEQAAKRGDLVGKQMFTEGKVMLVGLEFQKSETVQDFRNKVLKLPYKVDVEIVSEFQQVLHQIQATIPNFGQEHLKFLRQLANNQDYLAEPIIQPFKLVDQIEEQDVTLPSEITMDREKSDPKQIIRTFIARAYYFIENKEYDKAIDVLNTAIALSPKDSNLYAGRASAYADQGKFDEALSDYHQAIRLEPNEAYLYFSRGMIFIEQKKYTEAIDDFKRGVSIEPAKVDDCMRIAKTLYDAGWQEDCIPFLEKAVALGEIQVAGMIREIISKLGAEAWINTVDLEKMRRMVVQFPHIASLGYIKRQEDQFLDNAGEFDRKFISTRLNLLRQATQEQRSDFVVRAMPVFQEFRQAYSFEKLQKLISDFPFLLQPGYVSFLIYPMLEEIPAEAKQQIEERFIDLQRIVNKQREQNQ